jgi:hypothetical protein
VVLDRGLWITWYDLPAGGRDAYFSWLHGTQMPRLLKQPGILWAAHYECEKKPPPSGGVHRLRETDDASIPRGNEYILLLGAETAHAFANLTPRRFSTQLSADDRKMLGLRTGERVNIVTEEARADGPSAGRREGKWALSPYIQLGSFNAGSAPEDELLDWYANCRLPSMAKLPGCLGIRKYASVAGWAKHVVLYEFESEQARKDHFLNHEFDHPEWAKWTDTLVRKLVHAPGSPCVARRIWPKA